MHGPTATKPGASKAAETKKTTATKSADHTLSKTSHPRRGHPSDLKRPAKAAKKTAKKNIGHGDTGGLNTTNGFGGGTIRTKSKTASAFRKATSTGAGANR